MRQGRAHPKDERVLSGLDPVRCRLGALLLGPAIVAVSCPGEASNPTPYAITLTTTDERGSKSGKWNFYFDDRETRSSCGSPTWSAEASSARSSKGSDKFNAFFSVCLKRELDFAATTEAQARGEYG